MAITDAPIKNDIQELQTYLRLISFRNSNIPPITPTGIYDSSTRNAVEAFQATHDLPITGVVDKATWDEIYAVYKAVEAYLSAVVRISPFPDRVFSLTQGDENTTVFVLQALIHSIGEHCNNIPPVKIDGVFGPATTEAVKVLQGVAGLPETGIVDDKTWDSLASIYNINSYWDMAKQSGLVQERMNTVG
ncbi:MAG: peptidoglycan-binding protein [Ruminococcus sp.]|jgi:murein L,D-transpeptidase YcbB/YkuD|nr:peptidoglycan-binding protein [Ruminococcus sp.]